MCQSKFAPYYQKLGLDFSVEKKTSYGKQNSLPHIHDQYELLFCLSDNMCFDVDSGSGTEHHLIQKNTLLLINNMDRHYFYPAKESGENIRYVVYFDPAYIDSLSTDEISLLDCFLFRPFPSAQILAVSPEQSQFLQQLLDKILNIDQRPAEAFYGKSLYLRLLLAELLLNVNSFYRAEHHIASPSASNKYRSVYAIINYIHTNYSEELTLDALSAQFFMNKFYLCEVFKKVTGMSPNQYIINCRLMRAKELLLDGYSVEDACARSGFNNMSHFSRTFKNKVGMNPKQYQKQKKTS